ncbi:glycosyl transferase [Oceanispirochaeta crateris]|uniref:Glycosyl transferase n=1 Tax=Oceanispirochaeta crateris TaxID=2518645 RepID=A0A5C1QQD9_9SPIO|nr:glycosyl transferase [Oceanispirochaeta crateris]QEN08342.1 glycosyl transferase [Oceanispirochaeta crateris]
MKYGFFDDHNREYVITSPATPYPWINYLGSHDFFSLLSNTAGGYSFFRDARLRRLTRYRYNNVPIDTGGRYFYIKEGETLWNPGWKPVKTELDSYECRHGMGYSRITGMKNQLEAETTFLVPSDGSTVEMQKLMLRNTASETKTFQLYSFMEFCLWNAWDDQTNFQRNFSTGEVEVHGPTIYHKTEFRERRNHYAWYHASETPQGFDTDRETFTGLYSSYENPDQVIKGTSGNSLASGWSPIASHRFDITLKAGEEKALVFLLGYTEVDPAEKWESPGKINRTPAEKLQEDYGNVAAFDKALEELQIHWQNLLSRFSVSTPDEKVNRMVNTWNQYQCTVTYNMARSASYFESGIGRGIGFRDTSQDMLGCVHQFPERVKTRLLDVASTQFSDGSAYHQFQPLTKKGNADVGGDFNDDPLWLIMGICRYIKETGDFSILDEKVAFDDVPGVPETIATHLERSFSFTQNNLGPHGLPLIGRADWNDCLNLNCFSENPDDSFQTTTNKKGDTAESLMIAGMFSYIGEEYAQLLEQIGQSEAALKARQAVLKMNTAVENAGWDGEWFLRAYDALGAKVGSKENKDGQIFIESQGFCSMARIGESKGWPRKALDSVEKKLATDHGIMILQPAYQEYHLELGEVSSYPPGYKENAGIFCHNNPWVMIGEAMEKQGDKVFDYYSRICPAFREDISDIHRTEPYVYSQMIAGKDAANHGEAKNSWLTGTASWNFVVISQWILGLRPHWQGLEIDPCIPSNWPEFRASRVFRNNRYNVIVRNPEGVNSGIKTILVNGEEFKSGILPLKESFTQWEVVVTLG